MYILNMCVSTFKKAGHNVASIFWRPSPTPAPDTIDESAPLVDESQGEDQAIPDMSAELGLTASYTAWMDSEGAYNQVLLAVVLFFAVAVIGFSYVFESWAVTDSIYFAVVIFTTVGTYAIHHQPEVILALTHVKIFPGYGDMSPTNDLSRLFTMLVALFGIVILGVFLGMVGEDILDGQRERVEARLRNAQTKVMEQFSEEDTAAPPPERTFLHDACDICIKQFPAILVLCVFGAPVIYLEGWDIITG
jgi:hypothetical protein